MRDEKQLKQNEENAVILCNAIRTFAGDDEALSNFESYLSRHFDVWMKKYASYPEGLASEFQIFANLYQGDNKE